MSDSLASSLQELDLDPQTTIQKLITRCETLNEEVQKYISAVDTNPKTAKVPCPVEYRSLRNEFKTELAFLTKLKSRTANMSAEKAHQYAVSSNLVYFEALWAAAKRSSALRTFRKYYYPSQQRATKSTAQDAQKKSKGAALVDIVAEDGLEWIRVSTLSEKRLLFDLAKLGWQNDPDSDDDLSDAPNVNWEDDDDEDQVDIVRNARDMARAARGNPIRGRPPKVRFVLSRIQSGKLKEIDAVLDKIKATGATVQCANEIPETPPFESALPNLLVDRSRALSDTLNIDCTILLALISDISHADCPILDWYPGEVRHQIEEEETEKLLPIHIYPAIGSHPMVCTQAAADQMNLIVDTLATDQEKRRANLLLAQRDRQDVPSETLLAEWLEISDHPAPEGFQLPIRVFPCDLDQILERLPPVAKKLSTELSPLNSSIFFYGWAEGLTTLSSNRVKARHIEQAINEEGISDGEAVPHFWLCGSARSLIAKHGRRK